MLIPKKLSMLTISTLILTSSPAFSHTPYLYPSSFDVAKNGHVSLDASFAERFFVPEVAFDGSIFSVITPSGTSVNPDIVLKLAMRTVVETTLENEGTYRFSTGKRLGRVFKIYELNGKKTTLENPQDTPPEGAKIVSFFQSLTLAETYVSKGAPNKAALAPYNQGLEFVALSHPNDVFVGTEVKLLGQFDGKPLANLAVDVFQANNQFSDEKPLITVKTNEQGEFSFTPQKPGNYLLRARHRSVAPEGALAPQISNTYTLVLEAVK